MNQFIFTRFAEKQLRCQEKDIQKKILEKLRKLKTHEHIFSVLKPLVDFEPATHRLRIGAYRLILAHLKKTQFLILDVGHRKEIYK